MIDNFDTSVELDFHPDEMILIDSFTPSVYGKIFKISYELILQVQFEGVEVTTKNSVVAPLIVNALPDLIMFSNVRICLTQPDLPQDIYPDLVLPEPLFKEFKP